MIPVTADVAIDETEIHMDFVRASGPGGQNVNKVSSAVQLRFDAAKSPALSEGIRNRLKQISGHRMTADGILIIKAQRHRTQDRNREDAIERLVARHLDVRSHAPAVQPDEVRRQARELDRRIAAGSEPGPLAGVPVAIKDNIVTRGAPTTCASRLLETYESPWEASAVARLRADKADEQGNVTSGACELINVEDTLVLTDARQPPAGTSPPSDVSEFSLLVVAQSVNTASSAEQPDQPRQTAAKVNI